MRYSNRWPALWLVFWLAFLGSLVTAPANGIGRPDGIISGFVADVFYQDPQELVDSFRGSGFNTVATTLAWSVIEKQPGQIDLSMYYPQFDALTRAGYSLIVLIDTSGREMRSDVAKILVKDLNSIPVRSQPDWIDAVAPGAKAMDFYGATAVSLDFEDSISLSLVKRLYEAVLPLLKKRYGQSIVGISPCVTSECEVKYSQTGFRWQSYSPQSQKVFRKQLEVWGVKPGDMPVMEYGNHLAKGPPRIQRLYPYLQTFRENSLKNYVCILTDIIRRESFPAVGYFGQTFSFTDGIYATGVIEKTSGCFDIAAIDYNFYNGYDVEFKPDVPAFLADYALTLGYKKVLVGLYMERFRDAQTLKIDPRGFGLLRESLERIEPNSRIAGIEVGNLTGREFSGLDYIPGTVQHMRRPPASPPGEKRVAMYASMANSYLWEGEWSNDRQLLQDNLLATYAALKKMPQINLQIITDVQLTDHPEILSPYDLVVLPHLTAMPPQARTALLRYATGGGKLLADMRVDEYQPDGSLQPDATLRNILGVRSMRAFSATVALSDVSSAIILPKQRQYITGYLLTPVDGFAVAFPRAEGKGEGLVVRGERTTTFGFLPLLVEGAARDWARRQFKAEVERLTR